MTFNNNGQYQIEILAPHWINIPGFGKVQIVDHVGHLMEHNDELKIARIKKLVNVSTGKIRYEIQLSYKEKVERRPIDDDRIAGLDWGLIDDKVFHADDGKIYTIPTELSNKATELLTKIGDIQKKYSKKVVDENDKEKIMTDMSKISKKDKQKLQRLYTKRSNILSEFYRQLAILLCILYDCLCIEQIDARSMRKERYAELKALQNVLDKNFNRKLALNKPSVLLKTLIQRANKTGKTVIAVDAYKTSQTEYGTIYVKGHDLDEREWISEYSGKLIDRDLNAAMNIKEWALHPDKHIKLTEDKYRDMDPIELVTING